MTHTHARKLVVGLVFAGLSLAGAGHLHAADTRDYVFVFIMSGAAKDLSPEQQQEAFAGHFSNMEKQSKAGDLLIAGPMGPPKSDPDHRGLWVFNAETLEAGMALAETDPTFKAGMFKLSGHVFTTDRPLTDLPRLEEEAEAARRADPEIPNEWVGRAYILATAPFSDELLETVSTTDGVLIAGTLHGSGPDGADEVLAWLDAEKQGVAEMLLPDGDWTWHGWYGSPTVEQMDD